MSNWGVLSPANVILHYTVKKLATSNLEQRYDDGISHIKNLSPELTGVSREISKSGCTSRRTEKIHFPFKLH